MIWTVRTRYHLLDRDSSMHKTWDHMSYCLQERHSINGESWVNKEGRGGSSREEEKCIKLVDAPASASPPPPPDNALRTLIWIMSLTTLLDHHLIIHEPWDNKHMKYACRASVQPYSSQALGWVCMYVHVFMCGNWKGRRGGFINFWRVACSYLCREGWMWQLKDWWWSCRAFIPLRISPQLKIKLS